MAQDPLDDILSDCLDRLQRGETVQSCLARYPDQAAELEPLLAVALAASVVPLAPDPSFRTAARFRFQGAVRHHLSEQERPEGRWWQGGLSSWTRAWAGMAAALLLTVGLGGGAVFASTGALPDSPLYPIKRVVERARLAMTPSETGRAQYYLHLADRRVQELAATAEAGNIELVERLSQDLIRHLELAQAEAGVTLEETDGVMIASAVAETAAPRAAPAPETPSLAAASESTADALSEKSLRSPVEQASQRVTSPLLQTSAAPMPIAPHLQAFFKASEKGHQRNLAHLTLAKRRASPSTKEVLTRVLRDASVRYVRVARGTSIADDPVLRVILVQGMVTVREGTLWIADRRVVLDEDTTVKGSRPRTGDTAVVGGLLQQDGTILAVHAQTTNRDKAPADRLKIQGPVLAAGEGRFFIPGYRIIEGSKGMLVSGSIETGHWVLVEGTIVAPGALLAERVRLLNGGPVPFTND